MHPIVETPVSGVHIVFITHLGLRVVVITMDTSLPKPAQLSSAFRVEINRHVRIFLTARFFNKSLTTVPTAEILCMDFWFNWPIFSVVGLQ